MRELWLEAKRFFRTVDFFLLSLCLLASGLGVLLISSAARTLKGGSSRYVGVQIGAIVIGVLLFFLFSCFEVEKLTKGWVWILAFDFFFIASLIVLAENTRGNSSWIALSFLPINVQPAEVAKTGFILVLARQMGRAIEHDRLNHPFSMAGLLAHLLAMLGIIFVASKDGGMMVVYALVFLGMCVAAGVKLRWFALAGALLAVAAPSIWHFMDDYQRYRLLVGFRPDLDPQKYGWQAILSRISIGGGRLFGQGLYQGSQTQIGRLPDQQTDFIFAVAGEEWGLVGCLLILLLLAGIIIRCLYISTRAKSPQSSLVCVGVACIILFQTIVNVGMCLALTPVIGLTLPFISYGGSSIITMFISMGLVSSVRRHKKLHWLKDT